MIKRVRIRNFRGVREGELELAPLSILLGANNSGKTTVLEALLLAHGPVHKLPYPDVTALELLRDLHMTLGGAGFSFLLHNYSAEEARIAVESDEGTWELLLMRKGDVILVREPPELGGQELKLRVGRGDFAYGSRGFSRALFIRSDLAKLAYRYLKSVWPDVWKHAPRVAEELSKLVHEDYVNFTMEPFHGGEVTLYAFLRDGRRVRLGDLGDGVRVLAVAMLLHELVKPKLLLWDDVEAHMNPSMLLHLAGWLARRVSDGVQVVLSTHSLEAAETIASAAEEVAGGEAYIHLLSLRDGVLRARSMSVDEVERYRRAGIDVRVGEGLLL